MNVSVAQALNDPQLLGHAMSGPTWAPHRMLLKVIHGEQLDEVEMALFTRFTGREEPIPKIATLALIGGRRLGKTQLDATELAYSSCCRDYSEFVTHGEHVHLMCVSVDRRQGREVFERTVGLIEASPVLRTMVVKRTAWTLDLSNDVRIEVRTGTFRALRGFTLAVLIVDEIAFLRDEMSATPDIELLRAARPALATIPGSLMLLTSSPYRQAGALFDLYKRHYGVEDSPVLVAQGTTRDFNPTISQSLIDEALEDDSEGGRAEWLGQFRSDLVSYVEPEVVDGCARTEPLEIAPISDLNGARPVYRAFVDGSSGRRDSYCVGIAHAEGKRIVVDVLREWRSPLDPGRVTDEAAALLKEYSVSSITGDKYAIGWIAERFHAAGVGYRHSERTASEIFLDALPLLVREEVELPPDKRLLAQIARLERRTSRGGRDSVSHPVGGFDDAAVAALGAALLAMNRAAWTAFNADDFICRGFGPMGIAEKWDAEFGVKTTNGWDIFY